MDRMSLVTNKVAVALCTIILGSLFMAFVFPLDFDGFSMLHTYIFSYCVYTAGIFIGVILIGLPLSLLTDLLHSLRTKYFMKLLFKAIIYFGFLYAVYRLFIYEPPKDALGLLFISFIIAAVYLCVETVFGYISNQSPESSVRKTLVRIIFSSFAVYIILFFLAFLALRTELFV